MTGAVPPTPPRLRRIGTLAAAGALVLLLASCDALFNLPPRVEIEGGNRSAVGGQSVTFSADASDPEGGSLSYLWHVDDEVVSGAAADSLTLVRSPSQTSTYRVRVTVSDGLSSSQAAVTLTVSPNAAPAATIVGGDRTITAGELASFQVTASDADGDQLFYAWAVDGVAQAGAASASFSFAPSPSATRTYRVTATVTDGPGAAVEAEATLTVSVLSSAQSGDYYYEYLTDTGTFSYTLDAGVLGMGAGDKHVYFVFTNTNGSTTSTVPTVSAAAAMGSPAASHVAGDPPADRRSSDERPLILDDPGIREFNRTSHLYATAEATPGPSLSMIQPRSIGSTRTFREPALPSEGPVDIPATLRGLVSGVSVEGGTRNLEVWVADDSWHVGGSKANLVNQAMVDVLADAYLKVGLENDIFDWLTGIFGAEWGEVPASMEASLIPENSNTIRILLYDIDANNSTNGGVVGLYYSRDNFRTSVLSDSNEGLMFYLDAVMYATPDGPTWETTDYWPKVGLSTLAHEMQHMIHYYRKNVLQDTSSDTWLNEMASLISEDLVARGLAVDGPRGVASSDSTAGGTGNLNGRLPRYNYWNDDPLTVWQSGNNVLRSYSIAYAYGAYLARNFGGAALFRDIVNAPSGGTQAVTAALASQGYSYGFTDTLRMWAVANLLSDVTSAAEPVRYNRGDWFTFTVDGHSYDLGSINLYNFRYLDSTNGIDHTGPWINTSKPTYGTQMAAYSNSYYKAGVVAAGGTATWNITLPAGVVMSVVVKE